MSQPYFEHGSYEGAAEWVVEIIAVGGETERIIGLMTYPQAQAEAARLRKQGIDGRIGHSMVSVTRVRKPGIDWDSYEGEWEDDAEEAARSKPPGP